MSKIPKVIHYCWFGNGPKSELIEKCIASWKKWFPDYEIKEWNELNFDINQSVYCKEAYEKKKWAFVSDYARLAIIYQNGGIYFDTDVEVLKRFDDMLQNHGYLCFEHTSNTPSENSVNTGLGFAAEAGCEIIAEMLHEYDDIHFVNNGEMDLTSCPIRNTNALLKCGLKKGGSMQLVGDMMVYPFEYFCGYDVANAFPYITDKTCTIHHYSATWKDKASWKEIVKYKMIVPVLQKLVGYENYRRFIIWKDSRK